MGILKKRLETCERTVSVHLDSLDLDVEIKKQTMADSKKIENMKKDPGKMTWWILSHSILHDGIPLIDPDADDGLETVLDMTAEMVGEIAEKYAFANGADVDELKKKAMS